MSKTGTFHVISGLYRDFPNFILWPILMLQKVFYGHFSRSLPKSDLKTCITALNQIFFCLTFFTWWPDMTLTSIMVAKHSKWYLKMSETLSMPISWLCLCLASQFCSPMSPSSKCRTFFTATWPVTSLVTPRSIKFVFLQQFFQGFQMPLEFLESVQ